MSAERFMSGCKYEQARVDKLPSWAAGLIATMTMRLREAGEAYDRLAGKRTAIESNPYSDAAFFIADGTTIRFKMGAASQEYIEVSQSKEGLRVSSALGPIGICPCASNVVHVRLSAS